MEHYAPHPSSQFEGFYSKFDLESGAHIALIICSVPQAKTRPHMVSFTYYPKNGHPIFQREEFVETIERTVTDPKTQAFELRVPGMGYMACHANGTTSYRLNAPEWSLEADSTSITQWRTDKSTPEGWIIHLPLPMHWHVHSTCSPCTFKLDLPPLGDAHPEFDRKGRGYIHQEKNWANSFPDAHMWVQAFNQESMTGVCLAGGKIMGQTAYLLGYRSDDLFLDFIPPFSVSYLNMPFLSPFMSVDIDWESRTFSISVSDYVHKLELKAQAPKEPGWFGLASPFPDGHRPNFCRESFIATIDVRVYESEGWMPWHGWRQIKQEKFANASLEFAGGYYPERGESKKE
ncbi:uncharacterized protein M421DRAFT_357195 [Didymella exigua CBS 183.55]|uniref:Uncharacterized protein n=1 Tax=Didymella exigua CBS 183.55 TaxID=1150837 RepID=A0A6A5RTJ8_9PLEO|nr:uncharacterized protein M421DRAFT_357195 [Didymella exigua CBS 183.55]KAF1930720.1 hypothetical protein M421DRAFT_357195 [Didymella exigua CBS 183.55]